MYTLRDLRDGVGVAERVAQLITTWTKVMHICFNSLHLQKAISLRRARGVMHGTSAAN